MAQELDEREYRICRSKEFALDYFVYANPDRCGDLPTVPLSKQAANVITEKKYTIAATDASYRVVNHWSNVGLFEDDRLDKKGWRKFSAVDIVWVTILSKLREFGLSLDKLKNSYKTLMKDEEKLLEFCIFLVLMRRAMYLIVFPDGVIEVATKGALAYSESTGSLDDPSYIVINLNNCMQRTFPEKDFKPEIDLPQLTEKEEIILSELRYGNYNEISIHLQNGQVDSLDLKRKHIGEIGKLSDMISKVSHGDFKIKKMKGKIVFVEETKKIKV